MASQAPLRSVPHPQAELWPELRSAAHAIATRHPDVVELAALSVLTRSALIEMGRSHQIVVTPLIDLGRKVMIHYAEAHGISTDRFYDAIAAFNEAAHRFSTS